MRGEMYTYTSLKYYVILQLFHPWTELWKSSVPIKRNSRAPMLPQASRTHKFGHTQYTLPSHILYMRKCCAKSATAVPARCPHGARYGARTVPAGKTRMIAQRAIELILVSITLLMLSRHVREFPIFYSGHRAGTVRAPCGHRAGTERAPIGRSNGEGRGF